MRHLSLSLIAVVMASIIGLGWIVNEIYIHYTTEHANTPEHQEYINFSRELAEVINTLDNKAAFVERWNKDNRFEAKLLAREDFPIPASLTAQFESGEPLLLENERGVDANYLLPSCNQVLSILLPSTPDNPKQRFVKLSLTLVFYTGVITVVLIWIWPLIHNLINLRNAAKRFGQGQLDARAQTQRISYIRDIESEFNNMADRIQSLVSDNKLLSRAVSHDLKTPVARLRFGLDAMEETSNDAMREKYAKRLNNDLEEMESLVDTLLQFARLDESRIELRTVPISIPALIEQQAESYIEDGANIHINNQCSSGKPPGNGNIQADKRYISMLTHNIMQNAVNHAKHSVQVLLSEDKGRLSICFEDDGDGIASTERENVLKPFWRGTQSRDKKGHGMGLAIVARIADWHGASLRICKSDTLGGAKVCVEFQASE